MKWVLMGLSLVLTLGAPHSTLNVLRSLRVSYRRAVVNAVGLFSGALLLCLGVVVSTVSISLQNVPVLWSGIALSVLGVVAVTAFYLQKFWNPPVTSRNSLEESLGRILASIVDNRSEERRKANLKLIRSERSDRDARRQA